MHVTGVGGIFFRAEDPDRLLAWYREHLGVGGEGHVPWEQAAGPTVFQPFAANTDMWPREKPWMLNFRVDDLDALLATLRAADIAIELDPTWDTPESGRFARIHDPEGNPIELWQPPLE